MTTIRRRGALGALGALASWAAPTGRLAGLSGLTGLGALTGSSLAALAPGAARAQNAAAYPERPVRLIVPYPPGGSVDPVARLLAQKLNGLWGQQVIVDNRPGASTLIGTDAVAKATPDGYTLLFTASTHVSNALLFKSLPYDSFKDFVPVAPVYMADFVLVGHPALPASTLRELIQHLKAHPNELNYGSAGAGNANHMAAELMKQMTGTQIVHVPYKGGGPLLTDLIAGQIQLYFAVPAAVQQYVSSGQLKAFATTAQGRLPLMPNVPTFAEAGLSGFGMRSWLGLFAPAHTPAALVNKVAADIARVLAMPDVKDKLESQGQTPLTLNPQQFAAMMKADIDEYARIIKAANIKLEQ